MRLTRIAVAGAGGRDDRGAVAQAARLAEAVQRAAGGQVLQRVVVGLARGARRRAVGEVGADDDVAQLGRGARGPAVDATVDDDAAAHAGADRDHHERGGDEVEVVVMGLGERGDGRVVVDEGRDPYPVGQQLTQRHALQRDVDRAARAACFEVDHARHADADGVGRAGVLDRLGELVDERVAVGEDRGAQDRLGEHAVLEDGDRDLGPADIDADQAIAHAVHVSDVVRSPGGRRPRAGGAPPGRRRRGVHGPRRPLVPVDDARRAHVRAQRGRRRGRRAGDLAGRAAGPRPLRGALVAAHLGLQHPRQPRPHARRARAALGARSRRSPARRATASSPRSIPIASSAPGPARARGRRRRCAGGRSPSARWPPTRRSSASSRRSRSCRRCSAR